MRHIVSGRRFSCLVLAWTALLLPRDLQATDPTAPFHIVRQGQPAATVVVPAEARQWAKTAGDWLVKYVHKASGAKLPVHIEGKPLPPGRLISVGPTALAKKADIHGDKLKWDGS